LLASILRSEAYFPSSHQAINDLLDHLDAIATTGSLAEWDARGSVLPLNGRGDPLPKEVENILRADEKREFMEMVDSVVEVGIVDLYGSSTNLPLNFLNKSMRILEDSRIPLPPIF
jgi:hypothetical protein